MTCRIVAVACLALGALLFVPGCKLDTTVDRCARCGMKLDPARASWSAELITSNGVTRRYDAPRCALEARRDQSPSTKLRVHEYYSAQMRDGADVVFVIGSDVDGPMGPDLVPVDPAKAKKFILDHAGKRALPFSQVTPDVLKELP